MGVGWMVVVGLVVMLVVLALYDVVQKKHAITRNFPIIGHLRFLLEGIGPELRQYIVTDNDSERPFSRDQRRWVYTASKGIQETFGFGTDNHIEGTSDYLIIRHSPFPLSGPSAEDRGGPVPAGKVLGELHGRKLAFRPASVVNVSSMSFGALSAAAISALNQGAKRAGAWQATGEGGISPHHLHGGDLVYQVGTGYFGCRTPEGRFSLDHLLETLARGPVRAIEIKLSQGAKAGLGGLLPAAKVTPEIAAIRGIPVGVDCHSPPAHTAFDGVESMCDFVEVLAEATGLPVGIKSAVGATDFWTDLAAHMSASGTGPDFITIDGGEGGTGAAPLVFSDHVSLPFFWGFTRVYRALAEQGLHEGVVFIGSGRLGLPDRGFMAMTLGVDVIQVAREAMLAAGCIQAQRCNTGRCPTGVATQSRWLQRGLDPASKGERVGEYLIAFRQEMLRLARTTGVAHPGLTTPDMVELLGPGFASRTAREVFDYEPGWGACRPESDLDPWVVSGGDAAHGWTGGGGAGGSAGVSDDTNEIPVELAPRGRSAGRG